METAEDDEDVVSPPPPPRPSTENIDESVLSNLENRKSGA